VIWILAGLYLLSAILTRFITLPVSPDSAETNIQPQVIAKA